jgi:hypothetical protein
MIRTKAAALALASGDDGSADTLAARNAASEALANLIASSDMSGKAAAAITRMLSAKSTDLRLFPEIAEIVDLLRKEGASGDRAAAIAVSRRSAEGIASSLIASKARVIGLAPGSEASLARLELDSRAYRCWMTAFPAAAYPGDLYAASDVEKAAVVAGVVAFSALRQDRAEALVEAMASSGDGRDAAAAKAARNLAAAWQGSSEPRRRDLADVCGLPESILSSFCLALSPPLKTAPPSTGADGLALMSALNGLAASIAEEEAGSGTLHGSEPSLILVERPSLASVARSEARYASLFAEASRRLGAIYSQAAEATSSMLESSPSLAKAAARALGSKPASLAVRAVDLSLPAEESGRRVAFVAMVSDASGSALSLPISADAAAEPYAAAFAKASGIDPSKLRPASLLAKYGQWLVSAYDPEGTDDGLVLGVFPAGGGPPRLSDNELELALLGGWRP